MVDLYLNSDVKLVKNNAGTTQVYEVDELVQLERFLILGTESGTFYVSAQELTLENAKNIVAALDKFGTKAVDKIIEIGSGNRAPKHEPVLFALAVAASHSNADIRKYALDNMGKVVRTGTHLFHFIAYAHAQRGWGRAFRRAIANWYLSKDAKNLAFQVTKYRQRDGWSHRDVLRVSHPVTDDSEIDAIFKYITTGTLFSLGGEAHDYIEAVEEAATLDIKTAKEKERLIQLITEKSLPREVLPTSAMKDKDVWMAMLPTLGYTALLRNLRNLVKYGVIEQGGEGTRQVIDKLTDSEAMRRARVHPAQVFLALKGLGWSTGSRGSLYRWSVEPEFDAPQGLVRTLEDAFYESFDLVEPTGKSILTGLDISASMGVSVGENLGSAYEWEALMAMVTARSERNAEFFAFSHTPTEFPLTGRESIADVVKRLQGFPHGGTDCSLPMRWAEERKRNYDAFFVYTDSETWAGRETPMQALKRYRSKFNPDARLGVVGMTATEFSIADPRDPRTIDVVGMDASVPAMLSNWIR